MFQIKNKGLKGYTFIDLFAGLGGFRIALETLGAKCVYSSEINKNAREIYYKNFKDIPDGDITKINAKNIPNHDILCAGFPCQAFSISGKQKGFDDTRGTLFFDVARIVKMKQPKIVFMENVKNFASHNAGRTLQTVYKIINDLGYNFNYKVLNATDYGIPQKRERIYMVCFRNDIYNGAFSFPEPIKLTKHVEDILLSDKEISNYNQKQKNFSTTNYCFSCDRTVKSSNSPIRLGIVNKGGQGERIYSIKGTAITLSAFGGGVFSRTGGYLIDGKPRKLFPRECARLMGFPDTYVISENDNQAYQQLGNSVVIDVLQYIGIKIAEYLQNVLSEECNNSKRLSL